MRTTAARTSLISAPALAAALVWGLVEFLALQGSRLVEFLQSRGLRKAR